MIGFDFDGVIVADFKFGGNVERYLKSRNNMFPLFKPEGEWVIVTGRPKHDRPLTEEFCKEHFYSNPPHHIFHENENFDNPVKYKSEIILANDIEIFIESNPIQVLGIQAVVGSRCKVLHFEKVINEALSNIFRIYDNSRFYH